MFMYASHHRGGGRGGKKKEKRKKESNRISLIKKYQETQNWQGSGSGGGAKLATACSNVNT